MPSIAETVVLLTTWNRPALLRQSLPQIEREAASIDARLVICDDQSSDAETLGLVQAAADRGADLIRRPYVRAHDATVDECIHRQPVDAMRRLFRSPSGAEILSECVLSGRGEDAAFSAVVDLWDRHLHTAHVNAQESNLFGFRHVLATYPRARWILKVDDDVTLSDGAFVRMRSVWDRARRDGHDVLAVSGIRTVNEPAIDRFEGYTTTHGICNVAVLYGREDWETFLQSTAHWRVVRDGFDLAFAWYYAPRHRPGAVALAVTPSVVYHTGLNGLHVRNADLNCEYEGSLQDIVVQ
jgi:hypothetical protein